MKFLDSLDFQKVFLILLWTYFNNSIALREVLRENLL